MKNNGMLHRDTETQRGIFSHRYKGRFTQIKNKELNCIYLCASDFKSVAKKFSVSLCLCVALALMVLATPAFAVDVSSLRLLPVLDHGRIKPIDSVARETVRFVTGYEHFGLVAAGSDGEQEISQTMDPLALVLDWSAHPVEWQTRPLLYVPLLTLRAKLGLPETQRWVSPRAVMENASFRDWVKGVEQKHSAADQNHETIFYTNPDDKRVEDAAISLDSQLQLFEAATDLTDYAVLPTDGPKSENWLPLGVVLNLTGQDADVARPVTTAWNDVMTAFKQDDNAAFASASGQFIDAIHTLVGGDYADAGRLGLEVQYNLFKPFEWASVFYFLTVMVLIAALMSRRRGLYIAAVSAFGLAIAFHGFSFAWRCRITGWAPVTNMYETVIWVAMMGAVFSFVLELIYRQRTIAIGGAVVALLATIVANSMPPEFGSQFKNLTPVLRSNYWLTIHVLTIVSSYAAFALALILGNIVLGQFIHGKVEPGIIRQNLLFIYRAVQIGVLLVASGTILGGLWADVSWGRFWGWDPKEVWALIVLLTYLALLHGRYAGWIKQFGLAAGAVVCFTAVLMSWYGVNFVLGAGLHSYGFNTGGQGYVATYVVIQLAYVVVAWMIYRSRQTAVPVISTEKDSLPRGVPVTGK
jgi:ABC-type transport system involved in cytochrome c biogenesis permease subunit